MKDNAILVKGSIMQIQSNTFSSLPSTQNHVNTHDKQAKAEQAGMVKSNDAKSNSVENAPLSQDKLSVYQQAQQGQNLAILTANVNASIGNNSAANNPMQLLYKTAIEEINKYLEPTLGKNAAQSAYEENLDVSPEATAERIVQGSTAFYEAFKAQNSELSEEESLTEFMSVINTGIDTGFAEAKDILDSLSVLDGEIETNIDATYNIVQQGLNDFKEQLLAAFNEESPTTEEPINDGKDIENNVV